MRKIRNKQVSPPGGLYFYKVPETGTLFTSEIFQVVVQNVRQHLEINKLAVPPNLADLVEAQMCAEMPPGVCTGDAKNPELNPERLTPAQIRDFTRLLFERRRLGEAFYASREEAERRAAICVKCPLNMQGLCTTCTQLKGFAARFLVDRKTSLDNKLGVCGKCGCMLEAKVHVSLPALKRTSKHSYPEHCWMNDEATNES